MELITAPAGRYTEKGTEVIHRTSADLLKRPQADPVHLTQYDQTLPIIAIDLQSNGAQYSVPDGAAVNIRMEKPDKKHVYNPALGLSEDRSTVYIGVTSQMTAAYGDSRPTIEIVVNGGVAGTAPLLLIIDENPVPEDAYESTDEYLTIQQIFVQVKQAAQIVSDNESAIQAVADNVEVIQQAPTAAANAAASATLAESWAVGGTGTREGEDANNAKFWAEKSADSVNGFVGVFDAPEALSAAYPTGTPGQIAVVLSTLSVWLWSGAASAWVDTAAHLYKAVLLLDRWTGGASPYTQTVDLEPMDGGGPVSASSTLHSGPMADGTGDANANAVLISSLNRINNAESITLGDNTVTVRVPIKPVSDVPVVFSIKGGA